MSTPDPSFGGSSALPAPASAPRALWRRVVEYAIPAIAVVLMIATPWIYWDRLPDPIATHWGFSGEPDNSGSVVVYVIIMTLITAAVVFLPLWGARGHTPRSMARLMVGTAWGVAALFVVVNIYSLEANADAATWEAAGPLTGAMMVGAFAIAIAVGLVGAWVAGDRPDVGRPTHAVEPIDVAPGEAVVWSSGAVGIAVFSLAPVMLVLAIVSLWVTPAEIRFYVAALLLSVTVLLAALGQCRVVIGPAGMRVRLGWWGWPQFKVSIDDIAEVAVENINPMSYGGWGVRMVPGATAVVMRAGEAIRVTRTNGRAFAVTVDDATTGASVLLGHVQARHERGPAAA